MKAEGSKVKRVVFIGAECTGKSTLARAMAERFGEPWSEEFVRYHVQSIDHPLGEADLDPIARGQIRLEDEAYAKASRYVFHDTNLLSSILYAEHYFATRIQWVDKLFLERTYDYYFLCLPDIPWEMDPGQRVSEQEREKLQALFEAKLAYYKIPYIRIGGTLDERISRVVGELEK